jgi:hypothetical protein
VDFGIPTDCAEHTELTKQSHLYEQRDSITFAYRNHIVWNLKTFAFQIIKSQWGNQVRLSAVEHAHTKYPLGLCSLLSQTIEIKEKER